MHARIHSYRAAEGNHTEKPFKHEAINEYKKRRRTHNHKCRSNGTYFRSLLTLIKGTYNNNRVLDCIKNELKIK